MQSTSKNILFPGHNHLLTTGADDTTLIYCPSAREDDNLYSAEFLKIY